MKLPIQCILYNSEEDLELFLRGYSMIENLAAFIPEFHFVAHDDRIDAYRRILDTHKKELKFTLDHNNNIGFASGHNWLFERYGQSYEDLFFVLNPDTILFYDFFEQLSKIITSVSSRKWGLADMHQFPKEFPKKFDCRTLSTNWCSGSALLVKTSVFREVEGFDERFFMYYEDTDLSWRVKALGYETVYFHRCRVVHRVGSSSSQGMPIEENPFCVSHNLAGELYMRKKYGLEDADRERWILEESLFKDSVRKLFEKMQREPIKKVPRKPYMSFNLKDDHRW